MAQTGRCSECNAPLEHPAAKTCGQAHRQARARRLKRQAKERAKAAGAKRAHDPHQAELAKATDVDALREVAKEELRPVVREAITEDVLRAAQKLVGLTPVMVDAIEEDLGSTDKILRQKAYSLLARYTLGNNSIAPQPETPGSQGVQVFFALPRPGSAEDAVPPDVEYPPEPEPVELRECCECHEHKPSDAFVGASDRCDACHAQVEARVAERFGDER